MIETRLAKMISRHRARADVFISDIGGSQLSYREFFQSVDDYAVAVGLAVADGTTVVIDQSKCLDVVSLAVACVMLNRPFSFLDPTLPAARKAMILEALAPAMQVRAESGSLSILQHIPDTGCLGDDRWHEGATIVFTSGSTGQPKGVVSSFDSLYHYVDSMTDCMSSGPTSWLSICPFHFDVFQLDVFVQLARGANIFLASHALLPQQYASLIREKSITEVLFISTMMKMIVQTVNDLNGHALQTVYFGGEGCPVDVLEKAMTLFSGASFCQFYGPTENCNNSTAFFFSNLVSTTTGLMPLGCAIKNVALNIVDDDGVKCLPHCVGEIVISGDQLFSGYLDVESRKFERRSGAYASNDLGFYDDGGLIWFMGRKDDIVKVNGNRVSLTEINNAIRNFVKGATVSSVVYDDRGFQSLVSGIYSPNTVEPKKIEGHLRKCLPSYCVPKRIICLPETIITRLSTGKTNYKAINDYLRRAVNDVR